MAHTWDANDEVKATLLVFPPHQCYVQVQIVFTGLEIVPSDGEMLLQIAIVKSQG